MEKALTLEDRVYSGVYDVAERYMKQQKTEPLYSKDVYLLAIGHPSNVVDMGEWMQLSDHDFIQASYLFLLGRYPSREEIADWLKWPNNMRYSLICTIFSSMEFINRRVTVLNCPYSFHSVRFRLKRMLKRAYDSLYRTLIWRISQRLPSGFKERVKKFFHLG